MTKKGIVAIIPVKGNSERVPKKNVRKFYNTNLLELKIQQIQSIRRFDEILISSEDENVLEMVQKYGVSTHKRDPYYSTPLVPMSEVYSYLASVVQWEDVAWINVTNPLAEAPVYEKAIDDYKKMGPEYDGLISVYEVKDYIIYNGTPVNFRPFPWPRSQDLKGLCSISFVISLLKRDYLQKRGTLVGEKPYLYYLDPVSSTDIDFQENFDFCETIYKKRIAERSQSSGASHHSALI